jgi:hypothetical protein
LIGEGFNHSKPPKRTALVALDLCKAFDSVDITLLLEQIAQTDLHPNIVCWLVAYLRGRSAACLYQGVRSIFKLVHVGVPQGSVLLLALFNFFVSDCPALRGLMVMFADNLSAAASTLDLETIEATFNSDMKTIASWAKRKHLKISPEKSQCTFFSTNRKENNVHTQIFYEGSFIPLVKNPRNLRLWLDPHFMYNANAKMTLSKIPSRAKVIKAITNSGCGLQLEEARATVEPVIGYCGSLWKPIISESWLSKFQAAQNNALRTVSGCHSASSMDYLHQEYKILPVGKHLDLLSSQFLASALRRSHPSHELVTAPSRPHMKSSLQTKYGPALAPYLHEGVVTEANQWLCQYNEQQMTDNNMMT